MNRKHRKKAVNEPQDWSLNLDVVHPNAAGIDIGNESHYVAVSPDRDPIPCGSLPASLKICTVWRTG